jgi:uncharacterized protein (TIGR00255 family)
MIHSMTAFSRADAPFAGGRVQWELKSVNHRFLEAQFRVPDAVREVEFTLRERLRSRLRRGKVDCTLRIDADSSAPVLELNRPVLLQLLAAIEQIKRDAPEANHPNPLELLRWPGVLGERTPDPEALRQAAAEAFDRALDALIAHRRREGATLTTVVAEKLTEIEAIVADVRRLAASLTSEQYARLRQRIEELGVNAEPGRLEQEIALVAQRADITEELDRLCVHVQECRAMLERPGPHGRSLDFLMQELNREANTLGAKSVLAQTAQRAIDLKVTIEQIREQVQNIE